MMSYVIDFESNSFYLSFSLVLTSESSWMRSLTIDIMTLTVVSPLCLLSTFLAPKIRHSSAYPSCRYLISAILLSNSILSCTSILLPMLSNKCRLLRFWASLPCFFSNWFRWVFNLSFSSVYWLSLSLSICFYLFNRLFSSLILLMYCILASEPDSLSKYLYYVPTRMGYLL